MVFLPALLFPGIPFFHGIKKRSKQPIAIRSYYSTAIAIPTPYFTSAVQKRLGQNATSTKCSSTTVLQLASSTSTLKILEEAVIFARICENRDLTFLRLNAIKSTCLPSFKRRRPWPTRPTRGCKAPTSSPTRSPSFPRGSRPPSPINSSGRG